MTQIYNMDQDDDVNRRNAETQVEKRFRKPLYEYTFPPCADVCFEGKCWLILCQARRPYGSMSNLIADLHSETGNHQEQVKVLIEKTASSLDNTALKMLFVSVQQNNIDLCVQYAINAYVMFSLFMIWEWLFSAWLARLASIILSVLVPAIQMTVRLNLIQEKLIWCTLTWFGHSYVSGILNSVNWYSLWNSYKWVSVQSLYVLIIFEHHHLLKFISEECHQKLRRERAMWNYISTFFLIEIYTLCRMWVQYHVE